jgi:hypothetical protein
MKKLKIQKKNMYIYRDNKIKKLCYFYSIKNFTFNLYLVIEIIFFAIILYIYIYNFFFMIGF